MVVVRPCSRHACRTLVAPNCPGFWVKHCRVWAVPSPERPASRESKRERIASGPKITFPEDRSPSVQGRQQTGAQACPAEGREDHLAGMRERSESALDLPMMYRKATIRYGMPARSVIPSASMIPAGSASECYTCFLEERSSEPLSVGSLNRGAEKRG